jgi:hypothetical protein
MTKKNLVRKQCGLFCVSLSDYDSISNRALKQAWLVSFKEVQIKVVVVEMKEVLFFHGKWENP